MLYAMGAIAVGLAIGYPARAWAEHHSRSISTLTTVAVFLVIYPIMVNLRVEAMIKAGRNVRGLGLGLALVYNFVWAPLVGLVLVRVFLPDPLLALGFLLVMVVPCSSMSIAYTGLAKGDVELSTVIVAVSFLVAVVAVPLWNLASDVPAASARVVLSGHPTLAEAQRTAAAVRDALSDRFALTNVTLECEGDPQRTAPSDATAPSTPGTGPPNEGVTS